MNVKFDKMQDSVHLAISICFYAMSIIIFVAFLPFRFAGNQKRGLKNL